MDAERSCTMPNMCAGRPRGLGPLTPTGTGVFIPQAAMQPATPLAHHGAATATTSNAALPAGAHSGRHGRRTPWTRPLASAGVIAAAGQAAAALRGPALAPGPVVGAAWTTDDIVPPPAAFQLGQAPGSTPGSARSSFEAQLSVPFLSAPLLSVDSTPYVHPASGAAGPTCWHADSSGSGSLASATYAQPPPPAPRPSACVSPLRAQQQQQQQLQQLQQQQRRLAVAAADTELSIIDAQLEQLLAQRALLQSAHARAHCAVPTPASGCFSAPLPVLAPVTTPPSLPYMAATSMAPSPPAFIATSAPQPAVTCGFVTSGGTGMAAVPLGNDDASYMANQKLDELLVVQQLQQQLQFELLRMLPLE